MRRLWRLIALLSMPAIALHELTHAAVAWPWADVRIEWRDVPWYLEPGLRVRMESWDASTPTWAMLGAYVAPLLVGYVVAGIAVCVWVSGVVVSISLPTGVFLVINWLYYTAASANDLKPVVAALSVTAGEVGSVC